MLKMPVESFWNHNLLIDQSQTLRTMDPVTQDVVNFLMESFPHIPPFVIRQKVESQTRMDTPALVDYFLTLHAPTETSDSTTVAAPVSSSREHEVIDLEEDEPQRKESRVEESLEERQPVPLSRSRTGFGMAQSSTSNSMKIPDDFSKLPLASSPPPEHAADALESAEADLMDQELNTYGDGVACEVITADPAVYGVDLSQPDTHQELSIREGSAAEYPYPHVTSSTAAPGKRISTAESMRQQLNAARSARNRQWQAKTANPDTARVLADRASRASATRSKQGRELSSQLQGLRRAKHYVWRSNAQSRKRVWTVEDLEAKRKEDEAAEAAGFGSGDGQGDPKINTIDSTQGNPMKIGKRALQLSNEFRQKHKLPALDWHQKLAIIGAKHSQDMADKKVPIGHQGFNDRVKAYPFLAHSAAENVAMNQGLGDPAKVSVDGWIDSPGHRKNLLSNQKYCGIGVARGVDGAWYLTQMFGTP